MRLQGTILTLLLAAASAAADDAAGEAAYKKLCASCHGAAGEGTLKHPDPLVGSRSLEKLAPYIQKSMPEDAPGTVSAEDARKIAQYIYGAFYSPAAQARRRPLRVELSRLTVRQYRNSVADLLETFAPVPRRDDRRGLQGEYFKGGRRFRDDQLVVDRIDPGVQFDFEEGSPAQGIYADEFSIRWSGGLFAPDSGDYEIVLDTRNGARLFLNDPIRPLIDGWVRSGIQPVHRETLTLLGGRIYPIRIEFFKAVKEKASAITLRWKRPHRAEELIPARHLSPGRYPEVAIVRTPFPPDDRSMGFERGTSISREWDEAATGAALEVAAHVVGRLEALTGGRPEAGRLKEFGRRLAERAFRRPLTPEQVKFFVDRHFEGTKDLDIAIKKVVVLVLKSPRFLYPDASSAGADPYDAASRISFALWDSLPDRDLLEAARAGGLGTAEAVTRQVERMLPDPRTRAKIREFYHQFLQLDRLHELSKDAKRFPDFTEAIISDLRTSLDLLIEDVTWSDASDFRQLLLAETVFLNGRLAKFYGAELPADAPFQKVTLGAEKQAGILTHPLLMAGFAYDATSSPIHRGVFVARSLLGRRLRPPPDAVTPLSPDVHPDMTTRERIALQTRAQACQSCHEMINPLGFALEHYDAVGRFRRTEKGRPIDASGALGTQGGETIRFTGARQLGEHLARSEETHAAFVEQLFHFLVKQPVRAYGSDRPEILRQYFVKNGYNIRALLVQMIVTASQASEGKSR